MDAEQLTNRIQSNSKTHAGKPTVRDTRVAVDADKIRLLCELFDAPCHSEQIADRKGTDISTVVNELIKTDREIVRYGE